MLNVIWYWLIVRTIRHILLRFFGGIKVYGEKNVPKSGPLLVAANHVSFLDPPLAASAMPRKIRAMAKKELFKSLFGKLIISLGAFPVDRGGQDAKSIKYAIDILKNNEALLLFPEGTRGDGVTLDPFNPGISLLARKTNAQILPMGIVGSHIVWPKNSKKIKRHKMTIAIGKPFTYEEVAIGETEKEKRIAFAKALHQKILDLCKNEGMYIDPQKTSVSANI